MHQFFLTNNLGGGGTNVSRFAVYQGLLNQTKNIGLLLNYYYLNHKIPKSTAFDGATLKHIFNYSDIETFLSYVRKEFIQKGRISTKYSFSQKDTPCASYLLDSGIGNLLRDLINQNRYSMKEIHDLVEPYHQFGEKLQFNILIALDYALKYTYKKEERVDENLVRIWEDLAENQTRNLLLLEETLKHLKQKQYAKHKTYAPLHGFNFDSFQKYGDDILKLEEKLEYRFDGYALGGIADSRKLKDQVWGVPKAISGRNKSAWLVAKLTQQTKKIIKEKPLHILGAGNIFALPFMTYYGATSSDCHSAWRRASDGADKLKILIPLFDSKGQFVNSKDVFTYKKLKDIKKGEYSFSLPLGLDIDDLKQLIDAGGEEYYFGQLLIFTHAMQQYDLLDQFMASHPENYLEKLCKTFDKKFNEDYKKIIDSL